MLTTISNVSAHIGERVRLGAWLYNKRSSGKIQFLQLRDGTGFIQGVLVKSKVSLEVWESAVELTQESSLYVEGTIRADERAPSGYEMDVISIEVIQQAQEYPIALKGARSGIFNGSSSSVDPFTTAAGDSSHSGQDRSGGSELAWTAGLHPGGSASADSVFL